MFKRLNPYYLVAGCLAILLLFPVAAPSSFEIDETIDPMFQSFPLQIDQWKGTDYPVDERTVEILETRNILSRMYEDPSGEQIHLMMVSSQKDRRVAHPPEVCYTASHYALTDKKEGRLETGGPAIPVKSFTARNEKYPKQVQRVMYLYKVGDQLTTNYYAQQLQFALDNLTRNESKILLIRISGLSESSMESFLRKILELV